MNGDRGAYFVSGLADAGSALDFNKAVYATSDTTTPSPMPCATPPSTAVSRHAQSLLLHPRSIFR